MNVIGFICGALSGVDFLLYVGQEFVERLPRFLAGGEGFREFDKYTFLDLL